MADYLAVVKTCANRLAQLESVPLKRTEVDPAELQSVLWKIEASIETQTLCGKILTA